MNIIKEIKNCLQENNKKENEILWIGSRDGKLAMKWPKFKDKFGDISYDDGFGAAKIAQDLVVVFSDRSWLERNEYDGAEEFEYKQAPNLVAMHDYDVIDCHSAGKIGWEDLADLNDVSETN